MSKTRIKPKPSQKTAAKDTCLCCPSPAKYRGLCQRCHQAFCRKVAKDPSEESVALEAGLVLPAYGHAEGFTKKLAEAKAAKKSRK